MDDCVASRHERHVDKRRIYQPTYAILLSAHLILSSNPGLTVMSANHLTMADSRATT